ncbi:MAG: hypothetical protein OEW35_17795 [Gammaproteobacteria bacterium]|nr:hypothetical protein [Gammaproteobacteria bacterium]MDH4256474.1 hypothetical protein [Gammaproteobacteria bacterium]
MILEWHDFVGTAGVIVVLVTYLLLQSGRMDARTVRFSALNAVGSALILLSLVQAFNLSAFVIELVWLLISLYGLAVNGSWRRRPVAVQADD